MDKLTPTQRHLCMSHIHSRDTKPELLVRRWLWSHGYRYRLNVKGVPGKPDIVMRPYHTAIFVNGCFWHGHEVAMPPVESGEFRDESQWIVESSKCCKIPQSNREFWVNKIRRNQERDKQNYRILIDNGWHVIVIWECQLKPSRIKETMLRVETMLCDYFLALHRPKMVLYPTTEDAPLPMAAENEYEYEKSNNENN